MFKKIFQALQYNYVYYYKLYVLQYTTVHLQYKF
jgi:hypothetical protein